MKKIIGILLTFLIFISFMKPVNAVTGTKTAFINPSGDAEINDQEKNTNFGQRAYFSVQSMYEEDGIGISFAPEIASFIRFDLSSIPAGSAIQSAYLKLYAYQVNADAPCYLSVFRVNENWNERTITYNNQPNKTLLNEYRYTLRGRGFLRSSGNEGWDMTGLVRKWYSGEYRNYGIFFQNTSTAEESLCKFFSKDETVEANVSKRPQLVVDYVPPVKFTTLTIPPTSITTDAAKVFWIADGPLITTIHYRKVNSNTWLTRSNNDTLVSYTTLLTGLTPNTKYEVNVTGRDDANRQVGSWTEYFTTKELTLLRVPTRTPTPTVNIRAISPPTRNVTLVRLFGSPTPTVTPRQNNNGDDAAEDNQDEPDEITPDTTDQNRQNEIKIVNLRYEMGETEGTFRWTTKEEDGSSAMAEIKTSGFVYVDLDNHTSKEKFADNFGKNQGEINHTVTVKNLLPSTTYHYIVYSRSDDNRSGEIRGTFTTAQPDENLNGTNQNGDDNNQAEANEQGENSQDNNDQTQDKEDFLADIKEIQKDREKESNPIANFTRSLFGANQEKNSESKTAMAPIWILITLVIILIVIVLFKKNKKPAEHHEEKPQNEHKHTEKKEEPPKKGHGIVFKIIVAIVVIYLIMTALSMLSFLSPMALSPVMLIELLKEQIGQAKKTQPAVSYKEAETTDSFAKLDSAQKNLSFAAVNKDEWPKGTIGGLYKIEPSGKFNAIADVTIDIKDTTAKGFALGYWHSDTKKWEYIPTIRIFGNTYKALIAHASEVGGYTFGLAGALEYEPHFTDSGERELWESLKTDLEKIARDQANGFDTSVQTRMALTKLDRIAQILLDKCAGMKSFENQMDYFFIWNIAQLLNAVDVDEKLGINMHRCVDLQATRADSKYEYMIRAHQDLSNDLNVPTIMQMVWKGNVTHEGYPLVSGYDNRDWRTDWQVVARTQYSADVEYGSLLKSYDLPTPEGTFGNGIVTHVMLFSLYNVKEGQTFKIRGVSIGDAPGYYRNWHEDFKWRINHPSTSEEPAQTDPNKHVFEITGRLIEDNGKEGAVIKYGGLTEEQKAQMDQVSNLMKGSGLQEIPAYFQELAPEIKLTIVKGIPYNE